MFGSRSGAPRHEDPRPRRPLGAETHPDDLIICLIIYCEMGNSTNAPVWVGPSSNSVKLSLLYLQVLAGDTLSGDVQINIQRATTAMELKLEVIGIEAFKWSER